MNYQEKSKLIMKYKSNLGNQKSDLVMKTISIADKVMYGLIVPSDKQIYIINKAYSHLYPIIEEAQEREKYINTLDEVDRLWEEYSSSVRDEEGLHKTMSYGSFVEVYKKLNNKVLKLEQIIKKLREE